MAYVYLGSFPLDLGPGFLNFWIKKAASTGTVLRVLTSREASLSLSLSLF